MGRSSPYFFSDSSIQCNDSRPLSWLPRSQEREEWGSISEESIQWGWASDVRSNRPVPFSSGHAFSIFDGSLTSKFEWSHPTLPESSGCLYGDENCQTISLGEDTYYAYNQNQGGRRCYGCTAGSAGTCADETSFSPDCSTALCARCNGLNNWIAFDAKTMMFADDIRIYANNSPASPRLISVYYSTESISGPWTYWANYQGQTQEAGWKLFSSQSSVAPIYARYFKIVVESNWGHPDKTELVEVELHGFLLEPSSTSVSWVDKSSSSCESYNSVSAPKWTFGFLSSASSALTLSSSSFVLEIESSSTVVSYSSTQQELYELFKSQGFSVSVLKNEYASGNQSGSLWEVRFYNRYPSFLNIRYRLDETIVSADHICFTECNYMPSDTTVINTQSDNPDVTFYPCAFGHQHLLVSDFLYEHDAASLCVNGEKTESSLDLYSVSSLSPLAGPSGASQLVHLEGQFPQGSQIGLYKSGLTHASECVAENALFAPSIVNAAAKTATLGPLLQRDDHYEQASICFTTGPSSVALLDERFDIKPVQINSVEFDYHTNVGVVGYRQTIIVRGIGFGANDQLKMVTGNCQSVDEVYASSVVSEFDDASATVLMEYTRPKEDLHMVYYFQDLCIDIEGTFSIKAVSVESTNFYMNHPTPFVITGSGFSSSDSFYFLDSKGVRVDATFVVLSRTPSEVSTTVTIASTYNNNEFYLYYAFGTEGESYKVQNAVFTVNGIREVRVVLGENKVPFQQVLEGVEYTIDVYGSGLTSEDVFGYALDAECSSIDSSVAYVSFDNSNVAASQVYRGKVAFASSGYYTLCYKSSRASSFFSLRGFTVVSSGLTGVTLSTGDQTLVKGMDYYMHFNGYGIYALNPTFTELTPNAALAGGECATNSCPDLEKFSHNKHPGSPYPYVTVNGDLYDSFVFENAGYTWGLNHYIVYDFGSCSSLSSFAIFVNGQHAYENPRDFKLQYLDSCSSADCAFLSEAPWRDIPDAVVYNLEFDDTKVGSWKEFAFRRSYSSRYFRLLITRNWGSTEMTIVSEVRFTGAACNALNSQTNTVRLVSESCEESSNLFVVGESSHSALVNTALNATANICYDFSNPDIQASPVFYDFGLSIAELSAVSPTVVAADAAVEFSIDADGASEGDKIMFVDASASSDYDCWTHASETTTGVQDRQTVTLEFDQKPTSGSFIVSLGESSTLPISISDSQDVARINIEHLSTIQDASVFYETAQQPNGKWTTTLDVTVRAPSGRQELMNVVLPSAPDCVMCYKVTCENPSFHFEAAYNVLEIMNGCTFGNIDIGHRIEILDKDNNAFYFDIYGYLVDVNGVETDSERVLAFPAVAMGNTDIVDAQYGKSCPESNFCAAFNDNQVPTVTVTRRQTGINSVGTVAQTEEGLKALVYISSATDSSAVCYKFGAHPWKLYNSIVIETHKIASITPTSFMAGVESTATLSGNTDFNGGALRFLKSGDNCNGEPENFAYFADGSDSVPIVGNTVTFTFAPNNGGNAWGVCYKTSQQDTFIYLYDLSIKVSSVVSIASTDAEMANDLIVADVPKSFKLNGFGFSAGDQYKWVDDAATCSDEAVLEATVLESQLDKDLSGLSLDLTFGDRETPVKLCYKFVDIDAFMETSVKLTILNILSVAPESIIFDGKATTLTYTGRWSESYAESDVATWTNADETVHAAIDVSEGIRSSLSLFTAPGDYALTYQFGHETPKTFPIVIKSIKVQSVTPAVIVSGCKTLFEFTAYNFDAERDDSVAFVYAGHSCEETDFFLKTVGPAYTPVYSISDTKVGASVVVDSQAVAGDYALCYKYGETVRQYADVVVGVRSFSGFEEAEDDSVVLLSGTSEYLTLKGASIDMADSIRFIPATDSISQCLTEGTYDADCDAPYEGRTFPVTTDLKTYVFFESASVGSLQVCYKFKDIDYWVKYPYTAHLRNLEGVSASYGSNDVMVAGFPKTFTYSGYGVRAGDKAFYTRASNLDCDSNLAVSSIETVDESKSATFSFSNGSTETYALCYQFQGKGFTLYSSFSLSVYELTGLTAVNSEESGVAIAGHKKTFKVNGIGVSNKAVDMARWVLGSDCNSNVVPLNNADVIEDASSLELLDVDRSEIDNHYKVTVSSEPIVRALQATSRGVNSMYVSTTHEVSFNFASAPVYNDVHEYNFCYKFGDEPFLLFENININVWDLTKVESYTDYPNDLPDVIVAGVVSPVKFYGNGLSSEDSVYFVKTTDSCRVEYAIEQTDFPAVQNLSEDLSILVNFAQSYESLTLCYQFGSEGYTRYSQFTFKVFDLVSFTDLDGSNAFILNAPTTVVFHGYGMSMSNSPDVFRFVRGESCTNDDESLPMRLGDSEEVVYSAPVTDGKSEVAFLQAGWYSLCYTFGHETTVLYPAKKIFIRSVESLRAFTPYEGEDNVIVKNVLKKFEVYGNVTNSDLVKFVAGNDCSLRGVSVQVEGNYAPTDFVEILYDSNSGKYYISLLLLEDSAEPLMMCYHPANMFTFVPTSVRLTVYSINEIRALTGSPNTLVAKYPKTYVLSSSANRGVQVGDQVALSVENCNPSSFVTPITVLDDTFQATFMIASGRSDMLLFCYKFGSEKWVPSINVRVNEILKVSTESCLDCTETKTASYKSDVFIFTGYGVSTASVPDQIKWVYGDDCNADAVPIAESHLDDPRTLSVEVAPLSSNGVVPFDSAPLREKLSTSEVATFTTYVDANGKSTITFLETSRNANNYKFSLCYKFGEEPFVHYEDVTTSVVGIDTIVSSKGSASVFVSTVPEDLIVDGYGLSAEDRLKFVSGDNCESSPVDETPVFEVTFFSNMTEVIYKNVLFTLPSNGYYSLCYKYGDMNEFSLVSKYQIEVYDISGVSVSSAVQGVETTIAYTGYGVHLGDFVRYVPAGSDCSDSFNALLSEGQTDIAVDEGGHAVAKFDNVVVEAYVLCYRFGDEPFKQYAQFTMNVASLKPTGGRRLQDAVYEVGQSYTYTFHGLHLSALDRASFLLNEADCSTETAQSPVTLGANGLFNVDFKPTGSGSYHLCYRFNKLNHASVLPALLFNVAGVSSIKATEGSSSVIVSNVPKTFYVRGINIGMNDKVALTKTDCSESALLYHSALNGDNQFTVIVNEAKETSLSFCYKYAASEKYEKLSVAPLTVVSMSTSRTVSASNKASLKIESESLREGDLYAFTSGSDCSASQLVSFGSSKTSESGISGAQVLSSASLASFADVKAPEVSGAKLYNIMLELKDSYIADTITKETVSSNGALSAEFEEAGKKSLCYKFGNDKLGRMSVEVDTYKVESVVPNRVRANDLVKLALTISPSAPADYSIKFVESGYSCDATSTLLFDSKAVLSKSDLARSYTVSESSASGSGKYSLCMSLDNASWALHSSITMSVVSVAMTPLSTIVAGSPVSVQFTTLKNVEQEDSFYFVAGECDQTSNRLPVKGAQDGYSVRLADSLAITLLEGAESVHVCASIKSVGSFELQASPLSVAQLVRVSGVNVPLNVLLTKQKDILVQGIALEGGKLSFVKKNAECANTYAYLPIGGANVLAYNDNKNGILSFTTYYQGNDEYVACFKFSNGVFVKYPQFTINASKSEKAMESRVHKRRTQDVSSELELTGVSTNSGSVNVYVLGDAKRMFVSGTGLTAGDLVYYVEGNSCDTESIAFTASVASDDEAGLYYDLSIPVYHDSALLMCYQFSDNSVKPYTAYALTMKRFNSLLLQNVEVHLFAANVQNVYTINANGAAEGDKIKFIPAGNTCDSNDVLVNTGDLYLDVTNPEAVPIVIRSKIARVQACYKFGDEHYVPNSIVYDLYALLSANSEFNLESSVAVVNQPKVYNFVTTIPGAQASVFFVGPEATDCNAAIVAGPYTLSNGYTSVTFTEATTSGANQLCFTFTDLETTVLSGANGDNVLNVNVREFVGINVEDYSIVAVAKLPKTYSIVSVGSSEQDTLYFSAGDCEDEHIAEAVYTGDSEIDVEFSSVIDGPVTFCYKFNGAKVESYNYNATIYNLNSWNALGSTNFDDIKFGEVSSAHFEGEGVRQGDRVKFIHQGETDCSVENTIMPVPYVTVDEAANVEFTIQQGGSAYFQLCYMFAGENWQLYGSSGPFGETSFNVRMNSLPTFTDAQEGSNNQFVLNNRKILYISGDNTSYNDKVKVVSTPDCSSAAVIAEKQVSTYNDQMSVALQFVNAQNLNQTYHLCYKYATGEYFYVYSVSVIGLVPAEITTESGSKSVVVAGTEKVFHFAGTGIKNGNKVKFVSSSCNEQTTEYVVVDGSVAVTFQQGSALPLKLCYLFENENWILYNDFAIYSQSVTGFTKDGYNVNYPVVQDGSIELNVAGYGIANGNYVFIVPSAEQCIETESTPVFPVVSNKVTYNLSGLAAGEIYNVCYVFVNSGIKEAPLLLPDLQFATLSVPDFQDEHGELDFYSLVGTEKTVYLLKKSVGRRQLPLSDVISTKGISAGDRIKFVLAGQDCATAPMVGFNSLEYITVQEDAEKFFATFTLDYATAEDWAVCYQFSQYQPQQWYVMSSSFVAKSVDGLIATDGDNSHAVYNIPKTFRITGTHLSTSDMVSFIPVGYSCTHANYLALTNDYEVTFTFNVADVLQYQVCYKAYNEEPMLVSNVSVEIYTISSVIVTPGSRNDAVVYSQLTTIEFLGNLNSDEDRVAVINAAESCDDKTVNTLVEHKYSFFMNIYAPKLAVCYKFANYPVTKLDIVLDVLYIDTMSVSIADTPIAFSYEEAFSIVGVPTTVKFYSLVSTAGDSFKWVSGSATDCTSNSMGFNDPEHTVAVNENGVATFTFLESSGSESWQLCYRFSGKEYILLGHNQNSFVGSQPILMKSKVLSSVTVAGSDNEFRSILANESKTITLSGDGLASTDLVYVTSNEDCSAPEVSLTYESGEHTLLFTKLYDAPLFFCYGFSYHADVNGVSSVAHHLVSYPNLSFSVMGIANATASIENTVFRNNVVTITFEGYGMSNNDQVYFVPEVALCGQTSEETVLFNVENSQAVVNFNDYPHSFAHLCYAFAGENHIYKKVNDEEIMVFNVFSLTEIVSVDGYNNDSIVATVPKTFALVGEGLEEASSVFFVTGSTCSEGIVTDLFPVENYQFTATVDVIEQTSVHPCIRIQSQDYFHPSTIEILSISGLTSSDALGLYAIAGKEKIITLTGHGISENDTLVFVGVPNILEKDSEDTYRITASRIAKTTDMHVKYTFYNEAPIELPAVALSVVDLVDVTVAAPSAGSAHTAFVNYEKHFKFVMNQPVYEFSIKYVEGDDCTAAPAGMESALTSTTPVVPLTFTATSGESLWNLCVAYRIEESMEQTEYFMYMAHGMRVVSVSSLTPVDGVNFAVANEPKSFLLSVEGSSPVDYFWFTKTTCMGSLNDAQFIVAPQFDYVFRSSGDYIACYMFEGEVPIVLADIAISVADITSFKSSLTDSVNNIIVKGESKTFDISGYLLSAEDTFGLSTDESCRHMTVFPVTDMAHVTVSLDTVGTYMLCYNFRNYKTHTYTQFTVDIVEINTVNASETETLILNSDKYIAISGYGISVDDVAYLVAGSDCSANHIQEYHPINSEMLLINYAGVEKSVSLCYSFARGFTDKETQKYLMSFTVFSITIQGLPEYFVAEKQYTLTFPESENNNEVFFVLRPESCSSGSVLVSAPVNDHTATVSFTTGYAEYVRVCYRYNTDSIFDFGLVNQKLVYSASVLNKPVFVLSGEEYVFTIEAKPHTVPERDEVAFAVGDQTCESVTTFQPVDTTNTFVFSISEGFHFSLCYKFSEVNAVYGFPSQTIIIASIDSISCEGGCDSAVSYIPKAITFVSDSIEEGASVKFVKESCTEEPFGMSEAVLVDANKQIRPVFNAVSNENLVMCVSFLNNNEYQSVASSLISMNVIGVDIASSISSASSHFVVNKPKTVSFVKTTPALILNSIIFTQDSTCNAYENLNEFLLENSQVTVTLATAGTYYLCMKMTYDGQQYTALINNYEAINHNISSITSEGLITNVVADIVKEYHIEGSGVSNKDALYLSTESTCNDSNCYMVPVVDGVASVKLTRDFAGTTLNVFYMFNGELFYPIDHDIYSEIESGSTMKVSVLGITYISGQDNIIDHAMNTFNARVGFDVEVRLLLTTLDDTTCSAPLAMENNPILLTTTEEGCTEENGKTICSVSGTVTYNYNFAEDRYVFCVKLEDEPYKYYGTPYVSEGSTIYGYVKNLLDFHALNAETANDIVVAEHPKLFVVEAKGWNSLDEIYWTKLGECSKNETEGLIPSRTVAANTFSVNIASQYAGETLYLCYRFVGGVYKEYSQFSIRVGAVNSAVFRDASQVIAYNTPKEIKIAITDYPSSSGVNKFKFVYESCSENTNVYNTVGFDWSTFTVTKSSTSSSMSLFLCYQFANEEFADYRSITVSLIGISGVEASTGSSEYIVTDIEKVFTVNCVGCTVNDKALFVQTEVECNSANVDSMNSVFLSGSTYAFHFIANRPQTTYALCYMFKTAEGYNANYYDAITVTSTSINMPTSETSSTYTVVGQTNVLDFSSSVGVSAGDIVAYVPMFVSCMNIPSTYPSFTMNENKQVALDFTTSSNNANYYLCYTFKTEGISMRYPNIMMTIANIDKVEATSGSNSVALINVPKTLKFVGSGIKSGDRVMYIQMGARCDTVNENQVLASGIVAQSSVSLTFTQAANSFLCYKFGDQAWTMFTQFTMSVEDIHVVDYENYGPSSLAVVGLVKRIGFNVVGDFSTAYAKFVKSSETCSSAPLQLVGSSGIVSLINEDGTYYTEFTLAQNIGSETASICIYTTGNWFKIADYELTIRDVTSISPNVSLPNMDVVATLNGYGISNEDSLIVIPSTSTCEETAKDNAQHPSDSTFTYNLSTNVSTYRVCYQFVNERWTDISAINNNNYIFIGAVTTMTIDGQEDSSLVNGNTYGVTISGYGLSANDRLRFVPASASDCSAQGLTFSDSNDYVAVRFVREGVTAATFTLSSVVSEAQYKLCYNFRDSVYFMTDVTVDLYAVSGITASMGSSQAVIVGQPKTFTVEGINVQNNDVVYLSNPNSNCEAIEGTEMTIENSMFTVSLESALYYDVVYVCYKFSAINKVVGVAPLSILRVDSMTNAFDNGNFFIAGTQYEYTISGYNVNHNDELKFIPVSGSCAATPSFDASVPSIAVSSQGKASFTFSSVEGVTEDLIACYKFHNEEWIALPAHYKFVEFTVDSDDHHSVHAIVGASKTVRFSGAHLQETDTYKWTASTNAVCADDATDAEGFSTSEAIRSVTRSENNEFVDTFTIQYAEAEPWTLCWRFSSGKYQRVSYISLVGTQINGMEPVEEGSKSMVIKNKPKTYAFSGYGTDYVNKLYVMNSETCDLNEENIYSQHDVVNSEVTIEFN